MDARNAVAELDDLLEFYILRRALLQEESSEDENSSGDDLSMPTLISKRSRIRLYVSQVDSAYNDNEFKSHFRLRRSTFEFLLGIIGDDLYRKTEGHEMIEPNVQLMIALWKMATSDSYRSVCDRFNVGKSTAYHSVKRIVNAFNKRICLFIKWPRLEEFQCIIRNFESKCQFPNVVGAIDGTHFEIETPKTNGAAYINRKKYASIQMQAVCDHQCVFTSVYIGHSGSVHDMRVFRQSPIPTYFGNVEKFPNNTHLLGDSAYALHPNLIVPYKDNGRLTANQKKFNVCLSTTRVTVERAFGLLKGRWRSLLNCVPMHKLEDIPKFVAACCILHNICILQNDLTDIQVQEDVDEENPVADRGRENYSDADREAAVEKRNNLTAMIS